MGLLTLQNFRDDMQGALGNLQYEDEELDRWINQAYFDLASSVDFEVFDDDTPEDTVDGQNFIPCPENVMLVKAVRDQTSDHMLGWVRKAEYWRKSQSVSGAPRKWTRHGNRIMLHPVPDAVYSMFIVSKLSPSPLVLVADVTEIPPVWDSAVHSLGMYYALGARGQEARAESWLRRAVVYVQSRITEEGLEANLDGLGASKAILPQAPVPRE
jgi:hypothetical protein